MNNPAYTYQEIARSYALWEEYVDPSGLDTEESFNAQTEAEKIQFITDCFGAETKARGGQS